MRFKFDVDDHENEEQFINNKPILMMSLHIKKITDFLKYFKELWFESGFTSSYISKTKSKVWNKKSDQYFSIGAIFSFLPLYNRPSNAKPPKTFERLSVRAKKQKRTLFS